jgi:EAL domain-containing protein (putative c-di-GMP-specific phosphodiesterase class I)
MSELLSVSSAATSSNSCPRCEVLPPRLEGPGTLHLRFPLSHSRAKLLTHLRDSALEHSLEGDAIAIRVADSDLKPVVLPFMDILSSTEQDDVRVLFQKDGQALQLNDYFEVESLRTFAAKTQSNWLVELINRDGLTSWFQPIVACNETREIFAYECLLRGMEGESIVYPDRILNVARGAGLLFQLDRAARLSAIRNAALQKIDVPIFINFTPTSIYDPVNCLRSTVGAVDEYCLRRENVTFEVIESEYVADTGQLKRILDYYRDNGFKVALDDLGSGYSSLNLLSQLRPDYIKLDRQLISGVTDDPYKEVIARKLLETAQDLGVATIAEGVEQEAEFQWLCEQGASYVQGYLIARPAAIPPLR